MSGYSGRSPSKIIRVDFYPGDYLSDPRVLAMTRLQELAYFRLIIVQARSGPLPNDPAFLAAISRCQSAEEFLTDIWPGIRCCFVDTDDGCIVNERMDRERAVVISRSEAAAEAGRRGGQKSASIRGEKAGSLEGRSSKPQASLKPAAAAAAAAAVVLPSVGHLPIAVARTGSAAPKPRSRKRSKPVLSETEQPNLPTVSVTPLEPVVPPLPTRAVIDRWNLHRAERGLGPLDGRGNGQLVRAAASAWTSCRHEAPVLLAAVDAYFADRDPFTVKQGHNVGEFMRTPDRWITIALGTSPAPQARGGLAEQLRQAGEVTRRNMIATGEIVPDDPPPVLLNGHDYDDEQGGTFLPVD